MSTTATSPFVASIVQPAQIMLDYAEMLLKDVPPGQASTKPSGYEVNHPVWVFGHLAIYPDKAILPLLGRSDAAIDTSDYESLFSGRSECRDDPEGAIYPPLGEIRERYFERTRLALEALRETPDERLAEPAPENPFGDRVTHVGGVVNFMLVAHPTMHFGQISAWRRLVGLGPCM